MVNMRHSPLVVNMHIQPLGVKVLGDHLPRLNNAARLREVPLTENLPHPIPR